MKANAIQSQLGSILDLFPTILNLANIEYPEDHILDGFDLSAQLRGQYNGIRENTFLNHFPHGEHRSDYFTSLVDGDWKVIYHYPIDGPPNYELYNLKKDPFESKNLSENNPIILKQIVGKLREELHDMDALYPEKDGVVLDVEIPD